LTELWGLRADEAEGENLLSVDLGLPVAPLRAPLRDVLHDGRERIELTIDAISRRGRDRCRVIAVPMAADGHGVNGAIMLMEEVSAPAST